MTAPLGVHFCGSIRLADVSEADPDELKDVERVLRAVSAAAPQRLLRVPDGEIGKRDSYILWQAPVFLRTPWVARDLVLQMCSMKPEDYPPGKVEDIVLDEVLYHQHAIQNYSVFARLKQEGVIDRKTRFQVCLPTPANVIAFLVKYEYRQAVEPMYEALLLKSLDSIQEQIPHSELAIQWDCPIEMMFLEGRDIAYPPVSDPIKPHFEVSIDAVLAKMQRVAAAVHNDVELGFHLCYGDLGHRHAMEPTDMGLMVQVINGLSDRLDRSINWVHMPVPVDRKDEAFFAPLKQLSSHPETEYYLGLVHANDLEGTMERISMAQSVVPALLFGVSTECGLGRTPNSDIESILEISQKVSTAVLNKSQ